jgi:hypothetical protein
MKKVVLFLLLVAVAIFQFCTSSKKAAEANKVTYTKHVQPIIQASCTPCHLPPQGRAKPLHTFETAKAEADDMIERIKRNPEEKGFMPAKHAKLPDATIAVFEQWKATGLAE